MKLDIIFLIIIGICIIFYFCTSSNTEHFDAASDAKAAVNAVYQADVGAIRTLADIATKLQTDGYTCPGKFGIGGMSAGMLNIKNPNGNYSHFGWVNNENYIRNKTTQDGDLVVNGNADVTGTINSPNLNRLGVENSDWLRINDGASVGQTALYGKMCIIDTRAGGGLCVGDWKINPGTGNIHATGNITAGGNINANSGVINLSNGWRIDTTDGDFRVWHTPSGGTQDLKFSVHKGELPAYINHGLDIKNWWGDGNGTVNVPGDLKARNRIILSNSAKLWADGNAFQFNYSDANGNGGGNCRRAYWWNGSVDNCYGPV